MSRLSYMLPIHRDDPRALLLLRGRGSYTRARAWSGVPRHAACYVRYSTLLVSCLISAPQKSAMSNADLEWDAELLDVEAVLAAATSAQASRKKRCEKEVDDHCVMG